MLGDIPTNLKELEAHIAKAEAEGKWLWSRGTPRIPFQQVQIGAPKR